MLKDSYSNYSSHGFILQKALKNKKFTNHQGSYSERVSEKFDELSTGYVAIIPPSIIVVDSDDYEDDCEFDKLCNDLGYTPEASVISPSGGKHYFFKNPHTDLVIGNHTYKKVDIYSGYQSVVPIVGTTVKNKQGELKTYQWADDLFEEIILNEFDNKMLELFKMRERHEQSTSEYDDLSLAIKEAELPDEEVLELCKSIPIGTYRYDTGWLKFAIAMYDRFEGSERGLEIFQQTCERYPENNPDYNEKKWNGGHFKSDGRIKYTTLRSLANEGKTLDVLNDITNAKSFDELECLIEELSKTRLNTTTKKDDVVRDELLDAACVKAKELTGKPEKVKLKNLIKFKDTSIPELPNDIKVYRLDNRYLIRIGVKVIEDVSTSLLREVLSSFGYHISNEQFPSFKSSIKTISRYRKSVDYKLPNTINFVESSRGSTSIDELICKFNPLFDFYGSEVNEDCVDEFFNGVWAGKLNDIIKLIGLTIKFNEQKLNRLMVIAPSNSGKSEIFTMLHFQKIHMGRLLNGMRGDKGVGKQVIDGLRASELMLIDEANKALEQDIKDLDKEVQLDQFGANGGTQIIPLQFVALTSTHSNATRNNSDELYNRFLQIELKSSEMQHTVTSGHCFRRNPSEYTSSVQTRLNELLKASITGDDDLDELSALQEKFRLPMNNDLNELLFMISEDFILETKQMARDTGEVVARQGDYYYKRKGDVYTYFLNKLGETSGIDAPKYAEMLKNHFIDDDKGKNIKVGVSSSKYYKITMLPFTEDEDEKVLSLFDDLDIQDF
jgi:hypothetical protein